MYSVQCSDCRYYTVDTWGPIQYTPGVLYSTHLGAPHLLPEEPGPAERLTQDYCTVVYTVWIYTICCIFYTLKYTHCKVCNIHYILYKCTPYRGYFTLYTLQCTIYCSLYSLYTVHIVHYTISSFILPPQIVCRSIFSSKSGSHLLSAILWLATPVIKKILDFPTLLGNQYRISDEGEVHNWKLYLFYLKGGKYWHYAISHTIYACF